MTFGDVLGLIFSYAFALSLLLVVETLYRTDRSFLAHLLSPRKRKDVIDKLKEGGVALEATPPKKAEDFGSVLTRKLVHIGAGMWIWAVLLLFDHWWFAIIPTATFIAFNAFFLRYRVFSAMDPDKGATPGTVYFAFSCTLLLFIFHQGWSEGFPRGYEQYAMVGIMAMTWGDAFSAIVGKRFGKHFYSVPGSKGHKRSLEGSAACFFFTFAAVAITLGIMSTLHLPLILLAGLFAAILGTLLEAVSPFGTDNLTVPIGVAIVLFWLGL